MGHLEPSSIEINEIVYEDWPKEEEIEGEENEAIPLEKKFITSPAEVNTHRKCNFRMLKWLKGIKNNLNNCVKNLKMSSPKILQTLVITVDIDTGDSPPICQKPYNLPLKHREWVQKELETLEKAGVIVRSKSPWASPIVVVPKKTEPGEPPRRRLCVDYRVINGLLPKVQQTHSKAKGVLTLVPLP